MSELSARHRRVMARAKATLARTTHIGKPIIRRDFGMREREHANKLDLIELELDKIEREIARLVRERKAPQKLKAERS
jgi:hypothetical protein